MEYEEFLENYSTQLQILDAIDLLKSFSPDALDHLDQLVPGTKDEKTAEESDQSDPTLWFFSPNTQSLWLG